MPAEVDETAQQWQREPVVLQVSASGASISRTVVQVSMTDTLCISLGPKYGQDGIKAKSTGHQQCLGA